VTSDNVSPLHLMDIKRVAFETRPVKSARPALATQARGSNAQAPAGLAASSTTPQPAVAQQQGAGRQINREEIAAIVDRFLAGRTPAGHEHAPLHAASAPAQYQPVIDVEAGSRYDRSDAAPQPSAAPTVADTNGGSDSNGKPTAAAPAPPAQPAAPAPPAPSTTAPVGGGAASTPAANGNQRKAVDFVSEDDVRRAIQKGEKIYVNARTIITPSARDMGDPAEVFAKV
jgi:hypothetical protein